MEDWIRRGWKTGEECLSRYHERQRKHKAFVRLAVSGKGMESDGRDAICGSVEP